MPRLPYAAKTLIAQVQERKPRTTYETVGEPDGFNVHRAIKFSKAASEWLAPIMEQISDRRVHSVNLTKDGYLHVVFTSRSYADDREAFPLDDAELVVTEAGAKPSEDQGSDDH